MKRTKKKRGHGNAFDKGVGPHGKESEENNTLESFGNVGSSVYGTRYFERN